MQLSYPENTIWYVEARSPEESEKISMGSAVAVRLRNTKKQTIRQAIYLITCAHVLKNSSGMNAKFLPQIFAWPPGFGKTPGCGQAVTIASEVFEPYDDQVSEIPDFFKDWVVLEFQNEPQQAAVEKWASISDNGVNIIGYPGGGHAFRDGIVRPKIVTDTPVKFVSYCAMGSPWFKGDYSKKGVSGGGIFCSQTHDFVGIHRLRVEGSQESQAIPANLIKQRIESRDYEIVMGLDIAEADTVFYDRRHLSLRIKEITNVQGKKESLWVTIGKTASNCLMVVEHIEIKEGFKLTREIRNVRLPVDREKIDYNR